MGKIINITNDNKKRKANYSYNNFFTIYIHFVYVLIKKKLLSNPDFKSFFYDKVYNVKYENIIKKSNLKLLPEEYFLSIFVTLLLSIVLVLVSSIVLLFVNVLYSIMVFYGGILFVFLLGIFLYDYPIAIAKQRGAEIDASMAYLLPYMKILSKELNLSKIVNVIEEFLIYKEIKTEFRKIKYYSNFLGYDIHTSIREAMLSCPSRQLSDLMNDLVTISNSGGDIYVYLERKLHDFNEEVSAKEKKNIETLLIYSQMYVVLLLVSPLFFTIMSTILNMVSLNGVAGVGTSNGLSTVTLIMFLLLILPFAYGLFMILVYYSKPLYSRLKPIFEDA
jgi:hypothetical protein